MERIVFLDRNALQVEIRKPQFSHEWIEYPTTAKAQVVERLKNATIAITDRVSLGKTELMQLPQLKLIAVAATGVDEIDLRTCSSQGIAVSNVRNWAISVPEHVFALILALRRNLFAYRQAVTQGNWQQSSSYTLLLDPMPLALRGSTLGIIGYGALGKSVAKLATAFGMNVVIAERRGAGKQRPGRISFEKVLIQSDVIVLLCPLNEETRGLISGQELEKMRSHTLLINCARGGVVDEHALAQALLNNSIGGAGVDVLSQEPPKDGNPLISLHLPNLIVTPHVAWVSVQSLQNLAEQLIGNLEAFISGFPRNLIL